MKYKLRSILFFSLMALTFSSCYNYRRLRTDEVVMKDGNTQTGTIIKCDSVQIKLKKLDESLNIIPWSTIDTIQGKKLKTLFFGINMGYYSTPFFSVFRNERIGAQSFGFEFKLGAARRGKRMYYGLLTYCPAYPYTVTKFGGGYQRYLGKTTYIRKNCFFIGAEFNLMSAQYNNGPQVCFEPFTGFEKKCNENIRLHFKFQTQINLASKNNQLGCNLTLGVHFMRRNFKHYYNTLNTEHRLPRK